MMLHIPGVLSPQEAAEMRRTLEAAPWSDGRVTVGEQGAQVKRNRQLDPSLPAARAASRRVLDVVKANPQFFSATLPLRILPPLFNRYEGGGEYGLHVDGAVMSQRGTAELLRSDVSCTLFLSDPADYDGGGLVVRDTYGEHEARLPAGDLVVYPSTSLHQVLPVTRGTRMAAFFWVQSLVRDDWQRSMLFELDQTIQALRGRLGEAEECVRLTAHYHNLLRLWAQT